MPQDRRAGAVTFLRPPAAHRLERHHAPAVRAGPGGVADWGYPRTSKRSKPGVSDPDQRTLTPSLSGFFDRSLRKPQAAIPSASGSGKETEIFRSGALQVEEAVASLTQRRKSLERDIQELEAIKEQHLRSLTKAWKRVKTDVHPFRKDLETLVDRLSPKQASSPEQSAQPASQAERESVQQRRHRQAATLRSSQPAAFYTEDAEELTAERSLDRTSYAWDLPLRGEAPEAAERSSRKSKRRSKTAAARKPSPLEEAGLEAQFVGTNWRPSPRISPEPQKKRPEASHFEAGSRAANPNKTDDAISIEQAVRSSKVKEEVKQAQSGSDYYNSELAKWKLEAREAAEEAASLDKRLNAETRRRRELEKKLVAITSVQSSQSTYSETGASADLRARLQLAEKQLAAKKLENDSLQAALGDAMSRLQLRDSDIADLNRQLDTLRMRLHKLTNNAKQETQTSQRLRQRLEDCTEALLEGMQDQHQEQEAVNSALTARVAELQDQLASQHLHDTPKGRAIRV